MPTIFSQTTYSYDKAHNRTKRVRDGVETNYSYNSLNQLTGFTEGLRQVAFAYDHNGNRATRTEGGVVDTYGYDYENRLVSLQKSGVPYAYTYDYRTRRVERVEGSTVTKIVFSGGTSVQEYECDALTVEYIRGSDMGGGIGGILYTLRNGDAPSYTHYNNRGDVVAKTDADQALTYQAEYEAFGTRTKEVGQTQDRQKANTKDEDPTGLLNEGFRYRDLETGSFITRDPVGFVDGPNLYAYVHQNPWTKFDPEGLQHGGYLYGADFANSEFRAGFASVFVEAGKAVGTVAAHAVDLAWNAFMAVAGGQSGSEAVERFGSPINRLVNYRGGDEAKQAMRELAPAINDVAFALAGVKNAPSVNPGSQSARDVNNEFQGTGAKSAPLQKTTEPKSEFIYGPKDDPKIKPDGSTRPETWTTPNTFTTKPEATNKLDPFKDIEGRRPVTIPAGAVIQKGTTPGGQGPKKGSGGADETHIRMGLPPGSTGKWEPLPVKKEPPKKEQTQ